MRHLTSSFIFLILNMLLLAQSFTSEAFESIAPARNVLVDTEITNADAHFQKSFLLEADEQEKELIAAQHIIATALKATPTSADLEAKYAQITGRLALFRGNKEKIRLGIQVKEHADRAIAIDPQQPVANAVLGVWHYELAKLSGFERFFAGLLYGDVPEGDMGKAAEYLSKAVRLKPAEVFYRVALAKSLIELKRKDDAKRELEAVLKLPSVSTADPQLKKEAHDLIDDF
jgi:tetratricopeptide (TPR) repeat protein